ncbi:MAG: chlamydia virulence plasmid protein pGP6-D [Parachlamydiales bacterium]|nr:chlamydia virulence plasmid protein pGP6-D [Parachlamydiales bacterium]
MTKTQQLATAFLQKTRLTRPAAPPISGAINAFNALFAVQELSDPENRKIERILVEGFEPGQLSEGEVDLDVVEVKRLTKELMAIQRQEMVLIGERIAQARAIFRKYKDRSFREWLDLTFGSFKSGYNYLAFYDLYLLVPDDIKARLKEMPAKAVYVLASKKVPVERKIAIVKEHAQETAQNLIALIQSTLGDRRAAHRPTNEKLIRAMEKDASMIWPDLLNESQRRRLTALIGHLKTLLTHSSNK